MRIAWLTLAFAWLAAVGCTDDEEEECSVPSAECFCSDAAQAAQAVVIVTLTGNTQSPTTKTARVDEVLPFESAFTVAVGDTVTIGTPAPLGTQLILASSDGTDATLTTEFTTDLDGRVPCGDEPALPVDEVAAAQKADSGCRPALAQYSSSCI